MGFNTAKAASLLPYLNPEFQGYGINESLSNGSNEQDSSNWESGNTNAYQQAKQFDPNASLDKNGLLQMDRSKLPAFAGGNANAKYVGRGLVNLLGNDALGRVKDPSKLIRDPNYGDFTPANNLSVAPADSDSGFMGQLGKYMPTVIGSVMALASGGAMSPGLLNMAQSLASGSVDWSSVLAKLAGAIANQYVPGSSAAINLAAGSLNRGN